MKNYSNYSDWNPSKGDYVKSTLIEQRKLKKKNQRMISLLSGTAIGIILLIILIITASKYMAVFG